MNSWLVLFGFCPFQIGVAFFVWQTNRVWPNVYFYSTNISQDIFLKFSVKFQHGVAYTTCFLLFCWKPETLTARIVFEGIWIRKQFFWFSFNCVQRSCLPEYSFFQCFFISSSWSFWKNLVELSLLGLTYSIERNSCFSDQCVAAN